MSNIEQLQDQVAKALEAKGVLSKLRAEIRKHVFDVMEEQENAEGKAPLPNPALASVLNTSEGRIAASLVADFLKTCHLDHTLSVFTSEADLKGQIMGKSELASSTGFKVEDDKPLMLGCLGGSAELEAASTSTDTKASAERASPEEKQEAKSKPITTLPKAKLSGLPSIGKKPGLSPLAPLKPKGGLAPLKKARPKQAEPEPTAKPANVDEDDVADDIGDEIDIPEDEDNWDAQDYDQGDDYSFDADKGDEFEMSNNDDDAF
uniref:Centrosomal protein 43 n=1 Tax=Lotharella globosa TaxID=91324 RepID=A0A7S3ZGK7_9EUKA